MIEAMDASGGERKKNCFFAISNASVMQGLGSQ